MRWIRDFEGAIFYCIARLAVAVSLMVSGATLLRSSGALLEFLRPVFGVGYGVLMGAMLTGVLIHNRRWKGLLVFVGTYFMFLFLALAPWRTTEFAWDEYLALSAASAGLLVTALLHYDQL